MGEGNRSGFVGHIDLAREEVVWVEDRGYKGEVG
jgi:hypothetical protein